jgi:N-glycosylase/DNA lyase
MAEVVEALPGFRLLRPSSPHETLFCFMCTANNHLSRITQMVRSLSAFGEPLAEIEGRTFNRFPTLRRIAALDESVLREQGFGYRAKTIVAAAQTLVERPDGWLEGLKSRSFDEARSELMTLPGIGPKLADCIALYGLGFDESTPFDTHLWNAVTSRYLPHLKGQSLTHRRYAEARSFMQEKFGTLAGWAHLYLYFHRLSTWRTALRK